MAMASGRRHHIALPCLEVPQAGAGVQRRGSQYISKNKTIWIKADVDRFSGVSAC